VQSVRSETSGLAGGLARIQANNLLSAAQSARTAYSSVARDPQTAMTAHRSLEVAVQGLSNTLQNDYNANNSRYYLNQVSQTFQAISDRLPSNSSQLPGPVYPPYFPQTSDATLNRGDARRLTRLNDNTTRQFQNLNSLVQSIASLDYRYRQLATDLATTTSQFQYLATRIREGMPLSQLNSSAIRIERDINNLGERIQVGNVDLRVSQSWFQCARAYENFAEAVGEITSGTDDSGLPGNSWNLQTTLRWIDQSIDQCDVLIRQFGHYYLSGQSYSRFITQLRNLKNSLLILKMDLSQNAENATLTADWQTVRDNFDMVQSLYPSNITTTRSSGSSPLAELEQTLQQLGNQFDGRE
jgi:hypothetical protein